MTLTFEFYLERVKINQHATYPGQKIFTSYVIVWTQRQTHR